MSEKSKPCPFDAFRFAPGDTVAHRLSATPGVPPTPYTVLALVLRRSTGLSRAYTLRAPDGSVRELSEPELMPYSDLPPDTRPDGGVLPLAEAVRLIAGGGRLIGIAARRIEDTPAPDGMPDGAPADAGDQGEGAPPVRPRPTRKAATPRKAGKAKAGKAKAAA